MSKESRPNIQIDDLVREMTAEEFELYLDLQAKNALQDAKVNAEKPVLAEEEEVTAL
jgi:hypothetical protein